MQCLLPQQMASPTDAARHPTPVLGLRGKLSPSFGHLWRGHKGWTLGFLEDIVPHPPGGFEGCWQLTVCK